MRVADWPAANDGVSVVACRSPLVQCTLSVIIAAETLRRATFGGVLFSAHKTSNCVSNYLRVKLFVLPDSGRRQKNFWRWPEKCNFCHEEIDEGEGREEIKAQMQSWTCNALKSVIFSLSPGCRSSGVVNPDSRRHFIEPISGASRGKNRSCSAPTGMRTTSDCLD